MFFFFDEDNNSRVAYLAFETYVLEALQKYANAQGKRCLSNNDSEMFDAFLPDGIDDIDGPLGVEIKYFNTEKKNVYFQSLLQLTNKINNAEEEALLLILGADFKEKSIESMLHMLSGRTSKKIYIWSLPVFNEKTKNHRDGDFEKMPNPNMVLVDAAINNETPENELKNVRQSILDSLKTKYKNEELALFLGAGVSFDSGVPLWGDLINKLLAKMIASRFKESKMQPEELSKIIDIAYKNQENSSITQMRYIRSAFDNATYNKLVHDALYSDNPKINTGLLKAISSICAPTRNHIGVQGIVTYNFDDLIERRLKKDNIAVNSIYDEDGCTNSGALSIFHVHGFLPKSFEEDISHELIFSEEDYHRVYRDAYCWSNLVQLNYLREKSCLFIGCSLSDPNLRRLLDVASRNNEKPRHFALLRRPKIKKTDELSKFDIETYRKIDMSIKEKCFSMMGINVIWIDDFKEIREILKWIKSN